MGMRVILDLVSDNENSVAGEAAVYLGGELVFIELADPSRTISIEAKELLRAIKAFE